MPGHTTDCGNGSVDWLEDVELRLPGDVIGSCSGDAFWEDFIRWSSISVACFTELD